MRRLSDNWRSEHGGIDSTLLAAGLLLTFIILIRLVWPLWHLFGLRTELARSLHMANRAAVGAFDRTAWTQSQVLIINGATDRLWDSLSTSLSLDSAGNLPAPQPLAKGPLQVSVHLEATPHAAVSGQSSDLLASRATLTVPVEAFGQGWLLRLEDVHYLHVRQ